MSNKRGTMSKPWRKSTPPSVDDIPRRKHEQMVTLTAYQALEKQIEEIKDFAIWMTGCGYDFTQHKYFIKNRDKLLK